MLTTNAVRRRSRASDDSGAEAIEFALVVTILVMLIVGIAQFGLIFFQYIQVAHAAREGVRWAALGETAQVVPRAQAAAPGLSPAQLTVTVGGGADSESVKVTATYPITRIVPLPNRLLGGVVLPASVTSVAEERVE